jgi:hypothetical protein
MNSDCLRLFRNVVLLTAFFSLMPRKNSAQQLKKDSLDLTFSGTKINPYSQEFDSSGKVTISGYLDTYYASYQDSSGDAGFSKFPTIAPRNRQAGLNIIQVSARYSSDNFRGTVTLFGGDCPQSSWSPYLNFVQEANAGFRIWRKLWFDAGFFRSHIGLESIQPRENMCMSLATTTYFEPYFMSGAKLTWQAGEKLAIQLNAFNSFNQFLETNKNKAIGISLAWSPSSNASLTFSSLHSDESPDSSRQKKRRTYNNLCYTLKSHKWLLGLEGNFGWQANTNLAGSGKTAFMYSGLASAKYRFTHRWAAYSRLEIYSDPDEILTGPLVNQDHKLVGLDLLGATSGFEFKPIPNSYFRMEGRWLQTTETETVFHYNGNYRNYRTELIFGLGFWF